MAAAVTAQILTATEFVALHASEISTATTLLISEQSSGHASVFDQLDRVARATSRAALIRAARAALSYSQSRLTGTDAAELVLEALRAVTTSPEAAKIR
jgi:hypothetical protein